MSVNETWSEGRNVRYLSDVYRSKFCVKQEDVSALFGLKCAVVYGIGEVRANEKGLQLNGTLEILLCANDDTILGVIILSVKDMKEGISWSIAIS